MLHICILALKYILFYVAHHLKCIIMYLEPLNNPEPQKKLDVKARKLLEGEKKEKPATRVSDS